ncbi:dimer_Tnp_hAT domain-containing protein [Caerostris extrusa]|uniref:Dimer_Tnp_hAT domain-containing protein n=1 Tax=Caerostris extrusa TaxID=172846 RepID=A0AAV4SIT6_CAEEX|nr:dimer_Tnp_hAT domain-containing protein [Caerostris extrusa]
MNIASKPNNASNELIMADMSELLDEVESKYDDSELRRNHKEDLDAIHSISSTAEPIVTSPSQLNNETKRKCNVLFVGDSYVQSDASGGIAQRSITLKRPKRSATTKVYTKKYFTQLSIKDLQAETTRRKQKKIIEKLFEKKLAVVMDKIITDTKKFKRIKSKVWSNFGDVRLLISEEEAKRYNIDHRVLQINEEKVLRCESFVACVKCHAVFSYESHSYGTSTLRSHQNSCGKQRYNRSDKPKKYRRFTGSLLDVAMVDPNSVPNEPTFQKKMHNFRDHASKLQEQTLQFLLVN